VTSIALAAAFADPPCYPPVPWPLSHPYPPGAPAPYMTPVQPVPPQPPLIPPPLLYVRFEAPEGSRLHVYRDNGDKTLDLPTVVGLRPGFVYRFAVSDLPGRPGVTYFPTLEIRGTMLLSPKLKNSDFPATVVFRGEELDKLVGGTLIRKAIILERPENALPFASTARDPIELPLLPDQELQAQSREHGLPLAYFFLGQRKYDPDEMRMPAGTIALQGDRSLPPPAAVPTVPWDCFSLVDPIAHMAHPAQFTTVYDGGDIGAPAGFDDKGRLVGVDPSDTVAVYYDSKGRRKIACSNRVALCIPRFILLRCDMTPDLRATFRPPTGAVTVVQSGNASNAYATIVARQKAQLESARERLRPSGTFNYYGTAVIGQVRGVQMKASVAAVKDLSGTHLMLKSEEDVPLCIIKWPDRHGVLSGELLTFFLRFRNDGKLPINDVAVVDNLTPRFEYVPGTSKADRDGTFTFQPNDVGSAMLRWEFNGPLLPGESGTISFQVKVR
jgi:uncharacterized repeat protein (TIGR01451 family)